MQGSAARCGEHGNVLFSSSVPMFSDPATPASICPRQLCVRCGRPASTFDSRMTDTVTKSESWPDSSNLDDMDLLPRLLTALFLSTLLLSPYARADYSTEDLARMALERTANFWNKDRKSVV